MANQPPQVLKHPFPNVSGDSSANVRKLPAASAYYTVWADMLEIQKHAEWEYEGPYQIEVRHRHCRGTIRYLPDDNDPIMSVYRCEGGPDNDFCDVKWELRDLIKLTDGQLQESFYTLLTDEEEGEQWPYKLVEMVAGPNRFTSSRPATLDEIYEGRNRRIQAVRDAAIKARRK